MNILIKGVASRVGTSTFAHQLARCGVHQGAQVLVIDCDTDRPKSKNKIRTVLDCLSVQDLSPALVRGFFKTGGKVFGEASWKFGEESKMSACLAGLEAAYDVLIFDIGWVFQPHTISLLKQCHCLLGIIGLEPVLIESAQKMEAELRRSFFPLKALRWVPNQVTARQKPNVSSLSEWLQAEIFAENPWDEMAAEEYPEHLTGLWKNLVQLSLPQKEWTPFQPEILLGTADHKATPRLEIVMASPKMELFAEKKTLLTQIRSRLEQKGIRADSAELGAQVSQAVAEILSHADFLPANCDRALLLRELLDELLGLGPVETLLKDVTITEVMVNGLEPIFIERQGKICVTPHQFLDAASLYKAIERILAPLGRRIDESQPMVDARLADGSRVHVIIPPLALEGPIVTIRKFSHERLQPDDLLELNSLSVQMLKFLKAAVQSKQNILVSGGTGSGKTTLLNILSSFIPSEERIITIEDAAELRLNQKHVVRLESRVSNIEGKGEITIRDLVRNALRMRPDRIVVGECRGAESLDMLQAMNTGHRGSLTTLHANTPRDAVSRLETLVLFSGMELPSKAIREQIASAMDLVVQISRQSDGTRKIVAIDEVSGIEGDRITLQSLFQYEQNNGFIFMGLPSQKVKGWEHDEMDTKNIESPAAKKNLG